MNKLALPKPDIEREIAVLFRIDLCCNNDFGEREGVGAVQIFHPDGEPVCYWTDDEVMFFDVSPAAIKASKHILAIGDRRYRKEPKEHRHVGNLSWDSFYLNATETALLLNDLTRNPAWQCSEANTPLFDMFEKGRWVSAALLCSDELGA